MKPESALLSVLILTTAPAMAQEQPPPPERTRETPPSPAAGSVEAVRLLGMAIDKMLAIGRGNFHTEVAEENSFTRQTGGMVGARRANVEGRWSDDVVSATVNEQGEDVVLHNGRMLVRDGEDWKLRASTLPSGAPAPFVLQPKLLFTLLRDLPAEARRVRYVEAVRHGGKHLVILGLTLAGETAIDFDLSGAIPTPAGMGSIHFAGVPGRMTPPPAETTVDIALHVDPLGGDVHRIGIKTYKENAMPGNVQIAFAGPGGGIVGGANEDEEKGDDQGGQPAYEDGLPVRKLRDDESMQYYRISFSNHGLAEMPELEAKYASLLDIR